MKTLWNALSFLAIVNLLALALLIGWLVKTDRLDQGRIQEIRSKLATTIGDEQKAAEQLVAEAEAAAIEGFRAQQAESPMPPSIEQINYVTRLAQGDLDRVRRVRSEVEQLRQALDLREQALAAEQRGFESQRDEWIAERDRLASQKTDAQFLKVVKLLEGQPSKQAKAQLALIANDDLGKAAEYLAAMQPRIATKVLREFKTPAEAQMANQLLERMKTLGTDASQDGPSPNADSSTDTS